MVRMSGFSKNIRFSWRRGNIFLQLCSISSAFLSLIYNVKYFYPLCYSATVLQLFFSSTIPQKYAYIYIYNIYYIYRYRIFF